MSSYDARVIDGALDELIGALPAISLVGPKGVGKTETARRRVSTMFQLDDPDQVSLLEADPTLLTSHPGAVLLDEWQRWPRAWDIVRRAIDRGSPPGSYLLTGSATPTTAPTHSGAGRIVDLRMRPMSLAERGLEQPTVSVASLLNGTAGDISSQTAVALADYVREITGSGFPGIRRLADRGRRAAVGGYLDRVVERDFPEQGLTVRKPGTLKGWLRAYAAATATTTAYNALLDAATPGENEKPAKTTTITYRDVLSQLWLLDPVYGWLPTANTFARLAQAPKHHLADPALAAHLLGADAQTLLTGRSVYLAGGRGNLAGALFESLVTQSVRIYAQAAEAQVSHLRTRNADHEIDLIVEGRAGAVVALEVKLSSSVTDSDVRHLLWLREQIGPQLVDAAVITTGKDAYRRRDGIAVIPAALLGP